MVNVHVLNQDLSLEGIIDSYVSIIWRPAYYDVGDFELYIGATPDAIKLLKENRYLVRDTDISIDNGVVTYSKVMIIKNIDLITDIENGDYLSITGKELKYLLHQRIVWSQTNLSGYVEAGIRMLVTQNAISPINSNRVIPNLVLGALAGIEYTIEMQITGDSLDKAITEICIAYQLGWDIFISGGKLVFVVYKGLDRSYSQSEIPYVVFSDDFDNLNNTEYQLNTENYANTTLIGGEGEGTERVYATLGDDRAGLDRYEIFTDARDISQNKDSETEAISDDEYQLILKERGHAKLATLAVTEGFSGEVLSNVAFKYGSDFDLGDTVTVINKYGITKDVMVLSAIESINENGQTLIPQFNI